MDTALPARTDSFFTPSRAASTTKGGLLKDKLELIRVEGHDGSLRYSIKKVPDVLQFDKGLYVFVRAIQLLVHKNEGTVMVGLAGASGSGKSTFSQKLQSLLPGITILEMDMYNDSSKLVDGNFDDPRLTDYDLLLENLTDLKEGKTIQAPIYDFKQSKRVGYRTVSVPPSRIVMVEGIYALSPKLRPLLDLRVSITGGVHFDLAKRVLRDINRSAQAPQEILQQVTETVYPMYKAFIEPDLQTAQLSIVNNFNPFSGFMNPIYTLKSCKAVTREAAESVLQADHVSSYNSETYDIYLLPPGEDPETCTSWLRMRNRDGRYTLFFEESVVQEPFVISPRVQFEVSVRVLGGLMSLGYEISIMMKRSSVVFSDDSLNIKFDTIEGLNKTFVQVQGRNRDAVLQAGGRLGLDGTYIARSYIELVQFERLTSTFQTFTDDLRRRFAVESELSIGSLGRSPPPPEFLKKITGFDTPDSSRASWGPDAALQRDPHGTGTLEPLSPAAVNSLPTGHYRHVNGTEPTGPVPIPGAPGMPRELSPGPQVPSRAGSARPHSNRNGLLSSAIGGPAGASAPLSGPGGGPSGPLASPGALAGPYQFAPQLTVSPPTRSRVAVDAGSENRGEPLRDGVAEVLGVASLCSSGEGGSRMERAMSRMALRMEELMAKEDKSGRTDASDNPQVDQLVLGQQQLLRELQHITSTVADLSMRLSRSEVLLTSTAVVASVCIGAVAALMMVRSR